MSNQIQQAINEQDPPDCAERHEIGLGFGQGGMLRVRLILKSFVVKLNSQSLLSSAMQLVGHILLCYKKIFLTLAVVTHLSSFANSE